LVIGDDGQGFDLDMVQRNQIGHLGIMGMKERAESLGGQLVIQSAPGRGTQIKLCVPISGAQRHLLPLAAILPNADLQASPLIGSA
jgi:nitrate/nitrite-specific signal transduction histidine kinase